jgi:F1F0 ATPase subunit 2
MRVEPLTWTMAIIAGGLLGAIFFGGLWWTVKIGVKSSRPALWFFGSLQLRMIVALGGIFWVSSGHWDRMVACMVGFFLARVLVSSLTKKADGLALGGKP